jgi:hypothetical protein
MKLIGLSLAVAFTEKLMPILERFTKWMTDDAIPAFMEFKNKAISAFQSGGLSGLATFLDTELSKAIDNIDWEKLGDKVGDKIEEMFTQGATKVDVPKSLSSILTGIDKFFQGATGASAFGGWKNFFDAWGVQIRVGADRTFNSLSLQLRVFFNSWELNWTLGLRNWGINLQNKLTEIAKTFFNAGGKWVNQAVAGFNDHKKELISAISGIVQEINGVLKKIITAFTISIKLPSWLGGGDTSTGTTGSRPGQKKPGRASGGPVIAGQTYRVNEWKQEWFTPNTSGRIDNKKESLPSKIELDDRTIEKLITGISTATIRGMNNA